MITTSKGVTATVWLVLASAIALFIAIWIVSVINNSINLPVTSADVTNETLDFTAVGESGDNITFTTGGAVTCFLDSPIPSGCGVSSVASVQNTTDVLDAADYVFNASHITIVNGDDGTGDYNVSYTYADYSNMNARTGFNTTKSTTWNAFILLSVGLIVLAAAAIIGYFGFGKR